MFVINEACDLVSLMLKERSLLVSKLTTATLDLKRGGACLQLSCEASNDFSNENQLRHGSSYSRLKIYKCGTLSTNLLRGQHATGTSGITNRILLPQISEMFDALTKGQRFGLLTRR